MDKHVEVLLNNHDLQASPITAQMFGRAGIEHMNKYGKYLLLILGFSFVLTMENQ